MRIHMSKLKIPASRLLHNISKIILDIRNYVDNKNYVDNIFLENKRKVKTT